MRVLTVSTPYPIYYGSVPKAGDTHRDCQIPNASVVGPVILLDLTGPATR